MPKDIRNEDFIGDYLSEDKNSNISNNINTQNREDFYDETLQQPSNNTSNTTSNMNNNNNNSSWLNVLICCCFCVIVVSVICALL